MKTIKELEAERDKTVENIDNCDAAECSHRGWDALLDKQEATIKALKDVKKLIENPYPVYIEDITEFRVWLKARING